MKTRSTTEYRIDSRLLLILVRIGAVIAVICFLWDGRMHDVAQNAILPATLAALILYLTSVECPWRLPISFLPKYRR